MTSDMTEDLASQAWAHLLAADAEPQASRRLLGELLVEKGLISDAELAQALALQQRSGGRLGEILVAEGWLTLSQLMATVSEQCGITREEANSLRARLAARRSDPRALREPAS